MKRINFHLYLYELIFASLAVLAHIAMPIGSYVLDSLARSTVLFFFILSSYFYCKTINKKDYSYKNDTIKRCVRLLIIWIATYLIYFAIYLPINISRYGNPELFTTFSFDTIMDFFRHYVPRSGFLWFIPHLVICYLIYPLINKINWFHKNRFSIIVPSLILILVYIFRLFAGKYDLLVGSFSFSKVELTRNFFFTGIPCFLIGAYIYDNFDNLERIKPLIYYLALPLLFVVSMGEAHLHHLLGSIQNEFYLSSIVIAIIVVIFALQNEKSVLGEKLYQVFGSTGPMFVYLSHVVLLEIYGMALSFKYSFILIIFLSLLSSLLLAFIYHFIVTHLKRKNNYKNSL